MRTTLHVSTLAWLCLTGSSAWCTPLITAKEAALPNASGVMATRGISRGPGIKLQSPVPDSSVQSPVNLKLSFEARGGEKIDPDATKLVYLKSPNVDLTPRIQSAISTNGIDLKDADIPVGEHLLKITVKDSAGRESSNVFLITVSK